MFQNKKIIIANWKMNPATLEEAKTLAVQISKIIKGVKNVVLVVCPPFVYLSEVKKTLVKNVNLSLGSQNTFLGSTGSFTGEVSQLMLKNIGCEYIILGHSEQRVLGETSEQIAEKVQAVIKTGFKAVVCVGEGARDEHGEFWNVLKEQITTSLLKVNRPMLKNILIAYEPVWAIGNKNMQSLDSAKLQETIIFIRKVLADMFDQKSAHIPKILYGGSVNTENVEKLLTEGRADGILLGRESLKIDHLKEIFNIAEKI
ncbi:MAG: triose-phosphate isomerase [bacterium]